MRKYVKLLDENRVACYPFDYIFIPICNLLSANVNKLELEMDIINRNESRYEDFRKALKLVQRLM